MPRSLTPNARPEYPRVSDEDLHEIKTATTHLTKEMRLMKKLVEDLQMQVNEKDAEIIKLNMHLGDEKKKLLTLVRNQSQILARNPSS
jgi:hypothetical protein